MSDILEQYTVKTEGPMGISRGCKLCKFYHYRPRGRGRGAGMREGNKQRGVLYQHMKDEHPEIFNTTGD